MIIFEDRDQKTKTNEGFAHISVIKQREGGSASFLACTPRDNLVCPVPVAPRDFTRRGEADVSLMSEVYVYVLLQGWGRINK
ncbi:hypothetical protein PoB_001093800 [Plakobranchus ocellatus]|uniref:Uncharacterized protein n=1 Tax=Plakobranchus ocellatus TaxID=259542 RepID=A0AAV3YQ24_9GAST|nr:hypothetical protein PoB_001093800 [Plakobranchus ocellatus]